MPDEITGRKRAAMLLVALGPELAGEVLGTMGEDEIAAMAAEMGSIGGLSGQERDELLAEFCNAIDSASRGVAGGSRFAMEALRRAVGEERATSVVGNVQQGQGARGFSLLRRFPPAQVLNFIQNEHPQTIAVILSKLDPVQAADLLAALPDDFQAAVATRMATLEQISPEMIREIESVLQSQLSSLAESGSGETGGGVKAVAEILNRIDRSAGRRIMDQLLDQDPDIAEQVKRLMFVFDDITKLDDRSIREVIKEIDTKELALAFKSCSDEVRDKVFANLSQRAGDMIREEMEYMGPVRLHDVQEAQRRIIDVILQLEEDGTVVVAGRGGEDEIVV